MESAGAKEAAPPMTLPPTCIEAQSQSRYLDATTGYWKWPWECGQSNLRPGGEVNKHRDAEADLSCEGTNSIRADSLMACTL